MSRKPDSTIWNRRYDQIASFSTSAVLVDFEQANTLEVALNMVAGIAATWVSQGFSTFFFQLCRFHFASLYIK